MVRIYILWDDNRRQGGAGTFIGRGSDGEIWISSNPEAVHCAEKLVYLGDAIPILSVGDASLMPLSEALTFAPSKPAVDNIKAAKEVFSTLFAENRIERAYEEARPT